MTTTQTWIRFPKSLLLILSLASACGEDTNITQFLTPDAKTDTIRDHLDDAQRHYNNGDYSDALSSAQSAYDKNPANEEAAILLGYINLSLAGVDTFQLARSLIEQSASSTTSSTTTKLIQSTTSDCDTEEGAVKSLCLLGSVVGLTDQDRANMVTDTVDGATSTDEYDFPKSAPEARTSGVALLERLNSTIDLICPFVSDGAKIIAGSNDHTSTEERHTCTASSEESRLSAKAHYLWSFAHLVEGVAFYSVFSTNLEPLAASVADISTTDASTFISKISEISGAVDTMMPTDTTKSSESMLTAVYNDLETASLGFAEIKGMPSDITSQITSAVAKLKESTEKIKTSGVDASSTAMKDQFTSSLSEKVTDKITDSNGNLNTLGTSIANSSDKDSFCTSYDKITTGTIKNLCD